MAFKKRVLAVGLLLPVLLVTGCTTNLQTGVNPRGEDVQVPDGFSGDLSDAEGDKGPSSNMVTPDGSELDKAVPARGLPDGTYVIRTDSGESIFSASSAGCSLTGIAVQDVSGSSVGYVTVSGEGKKDCQPKGKPRGDDPVRVMTFSVSGGVVDIVKHAYASQKPAEGS